MRRLFAVVALVAGLAGCWPAPGQGPNRQSFNSLEDTISVANAATLTQAWSAVVGGRHTPGVPEPAQAGHPVVSARGILYVPTVSSLEAFDPASGAPRWRLDLVNEPGPIDSQAVVLSDDRVIVGGGSHRLGISMFSFDALTGSAAPAPPLAGFADSVREPWLASTISREGFQAFHYHTALRVMNLGDPTQAWEGWLDQNVDGFFTTHLTLATNRVLYAGQGLLSAAPGGSTFGNAVRSFPVAAGVANCGPSDEPRYACPQWITPVDGTHSSSPVLSDDQATAYVGTDAGTLYALDTATGAIRWSLPVGSPVAQSPALAYGTLFVPTASGALVALDAATGSRQWSTAATSALSAQPAVAGGVVVTGAADGTVAAYDAAGCGATTCSSLWSATTGSRITGAPAISLGKVFVGTQDGHLIAYGLPAG